jgi:selenocysteine-specific elongation factor
MAPGNRTAVNLAGVDHHEVARGDVLVEPDRWHRTTRIDASLHVLPALDHVVGRKGAYLCHLGSGEHAVRLRVLGATSIEPGDTGLVRLHLPSALPLLPGDRYVLREAGRQEVVGGGEVLDVAPVLPASKARPDRSVARVVAERGWVETRELERLTGEAVAPVVGTWVVSPEARAAAEARVREAVEQAGPLGLDVATLDDRHRAVLATLGDVRVEGGRAGATDALAGHPYVAALEASPFSPPAPDGVDRGELRELVRRGHVVERDGTWFAPAAIDAAAREVARLLEGAPEGVTVAQVRDALGATRKHVLPLLAHLDATGVTRRRGDVRIGGPRLPTPSSGRDQSQ